MYMREASAAPLSIIKIYPRNGKASQFCPAVQLTSHLDEIPLSQRDIVCLTSLLIFYHFLHIEWIIYGRKCSITNLYIF